MIFRCRLSRSTDSVKHAGAATWRIAAALCFHAIEYYAIFLVGCLLWTDVKRNMVLVCGALLIAVFTHVAGLLLHKASKYVTVRGLLTRLFVLVLPTLISASPGEMGSIYRVRARVVDQDLKRIGQALEAYRDGNGCYPLGLDQLTPPLSQSLLDDRFGNGTYLYRRLGEQKAVVYSVGPDGRDDGAQKCLSGPFMRYARTSFPFSLMPPCVYRLCYESTMAEGDICFFVSSGAEVNE